MAEEQAAAQENAPKPQFGIERIYLKDLSLECPKGHDAFKLEWKPRIDLDINNSQTKLEDDLYEVVLRLTITAKNAETEESIYLIEIHQAGTFRASGIADAELRRVLSTVAPTTLFPYARESIDSLVTKANFPPLRLAPINFDLLLAQAIQRQKQAQENQASEEAAETIQ